MIEEITAPQVTSKPKRPFWVWGFTMYSLVFAGILPVAAAVWMVISGRFPDYTYSFVYTLILDSGIIIASILTWKGNNTGRILFLTLITIHYLSISYQNFSAINSGQISDDDLATYWGRVVRGIIYPPLYIWYFTKTKAREFFKPQTFTNPQN